MRGFIHHTRVCSGDGVTGDGGDGNVTSDKIFTGEVTGEGMVTGEAFLTGEIYLDTLQMPPIQPFIFLFVPDCPPALLAALNGTFSPGGLF